MKYQFSKTGTMPFAGIDSTFERNTPEKQAEAIPSSANAELIKVLNEMKIQNDQQA